MASDTNHVATDQSRFLIRGAAKAEIVSSDVPISFMMGVNAQTGIVQDKHHPLLGVSIKDKILIIPRGRGSCGGSGVIVEMLLVGSAPAALIFRSREDILTLGVLLAKIMFKKSIPVVLIENPETWAIVSKASSMRISADGCIEVDSVRIDVSAPPATSEVTTTPEDERMLRGEGHSLATKLAMEVIVNFAAIQGAKSLISVSQAHIDACCYAGKASLTIPERLVEFGARVAVPTTCNSLDVDRRRWRELKADPELSKISYAIGDAYLAMGAQISFTCAPYLLDSRPKLGDQVSWGESNAVVYANSVLGARTQKFPDFLEVMVALTGRAPLVGCHLSEGRIPQIRITILESAVAGCDESIFPLLGYCIGEIVGPNIPIIEGLSNLSITVPDLKAFGAGFATTSSAPMFHISEVTPEAHLFKDDCKSTLEHVIINEAGLRTTWQELNTAADNSVDLISLGNPHFSSEEFAALAGLVRGTRIKKGVTMIITTGRFIHEEASKAGHVKVIEDFGASFITDTCWCMLTEPIIPKRARNIMTNSSKYAHYGPGITERRFHFGNLASCAEAAVSGYRSTESLKPAWLFR